MADGPHIDTPRGSIIVTKGGKAELVWNADFKPKWQRRYTRAQMFVDSEILRLSEPFTPKQTGMLVLSGTLGTQIGSGEVKWIAPYARAVYYRPGAIGRNTGPLRGNFWFSRMKAVYGRAIIAGAKRMAGRG